MISASVLWAGLAPSEPVSCFHRLTARRGDLGGNTGGRDVCWLSGVMDPQVWDRSGREAGQGGEAQQAVCADERMEAQKGGS